MTFALAINVLMVVAGAALFGWLLRWNSVQGDSPTDPRDLARQEVDRAAEEETTA